jgi:hypothetical protein
MFQHVDFKSRLGKLRGGQITCSLRIPEEIFRSPRTPRRLNIQEHRNRVDAAERSFGESERISGSMDEDHYGQGIALLSRAMISFRKGKAPQARSFLSKAKVMLERAGSEPGNDDKSELDWLAQELTKVSE